jgi:hypothetical protein
MMQWRNGWGTEVAAVEAAVQLPGQVAVETDL